jgi:hypothetical protein
MVDKAKHIAAAPGALTVFRQRCGTIEEHAIADLICDLGHLAEERDLDFIAEVSPTSPTRLDFCDFRLGFGG